MPLNDYSAHLQLTSLKKRSMSNQLELNNTGVVTRVVCVNFFLRHLPCSALSAVRRNEGQARKPASNLLHSKTKNNSR